MDNKKKVKIIPIDINELKTGTSQKNGKTFKWTLYKVSAKVLPNEKQVELTGFNELVLGQENEVEIWKETSEKYGEQFKYQKPKINLFAKIEELEKRIEALENSTPISDNEEDIDIDDLGDDDIFGDLDEE